MAGRPSIPAGVIAGVCAAALLAPVSSFVARDAVSDTSIGGIPPRRIERDVRRFRMVATDNVMELLAIRPGMTVLDIGAGTGQFAYEFARRLHGTGTVYATDAQAQCVDYMRREAGRRGLANLRPVLVNKEGIDDFYAQTRYDLITVFHVAMNYEEKIDYFRTLRGFLAKEGRLVLILYKIPRPFSPDDFPGDFRGLAAELSRERADSPYYELLKASTKKRIRDVAGEDSIEDLKKAVVADFNDALADTRLAARYFTGSALRTGTAFSPEEQSYADWLLLSFPDNTAVNRRVKPGSALGANMVATINKLLITQRFRKYLNTDGFYQSGFSPLARAAFEKAGYRIEREYADLIPFEDVIVMSAREAGPQIERVP